VRWTPKTDGETMGTGFIDELKDALKLKYEEQHPEKGDSWEECSLAFLWEKLEEEAVEALAAGAAQYEPSKRVLNELEDVALVAAMLWAREKENLVNHLAEKLPDDFLVGLYGQR